MSIPWPSITQFLDTVTAVGGTVPASLTDVVAARAAVRTWSPPQSEDIADVIKRGELTAATTHDVLDAALTAPERQPQAVAQRAEWALADRAATLILGAAGDAILTSVKAAHSAAVTKMTAARDVLPASTTAAEALEIDGGVAAWRDLAEARAVLDKIHSLVDTLLISFDALGSPEDWMRGYARGYLYAAMYTNGVDGPIHRVGEILNTADGGMRYRGGRWHLGPNYLHLNTLTEANAIITAHRQQAAERRAAEYAATHSG